MNEPTLFSSKILTLFCKSYLEAGEKLDDISYSVSPLSRLIGDFFKTMLTRSDIPIDGFGSDSIRNIMAKFFFQQFRTDLFYMLSNWLLLQSKTFSTSEGFTHITLLMKMYLIGIYTEENTGRQQELIKNLKECQKTFNEAAELHLVKIIAELCQVATIKDYLQVDQDASISELFKASKNWSETTEEILCSVKVFSRLGEVLWTTVGHLSPNKRIDALRLLTNSKKTPQGTMNSMQLVFYMVTVLNLTTEPNAPVIFTNRLEGVPSPQQALDYNPDQIWTEQIHQLLEKTLFNLAYIVSEYLGNLEHEQLIETMFKVLQLLEMKKNGKWLDILKSLQDHLDNLLKLKKVLYDMAMASLIPFTVYKLQEEFLVTKVITGLKEALEIINQIGLFIKGTAASIITTSDILAKRKIENLNKIIKPLLALFKLRVELDETWGVLFAQGLFNICISFEDQSTHPNDKIISTVLALCNEKDDPEVLKPEEPEAKPSKTSVEISPIKPLIYFTLMLRRYKAQSFTKYKSLAGVYESPRLIRLFLPIINETCPSSFGISLFENHIKKIQDVKEFKQSFIILFILTQLKLQVATQPDGDSSALLNTLLGYLHEEITKVSIISLETMLQLLREFEREMIPYSKIFIKRTLKLINSDIAYDQKKLVYELFSRILTLSYVQDSEIQPQHLDPTMLGKWERGNSFLMEFRSNKLYMVDIPDIHSVKLRPYQLEGIAWVNFLFKYNLSGALCDDMGLGKTVQSLITVLIFQQKHPGSRSLIVCPNGLVKHWEMEAKKHFQGHNLKIAILEKGFTGNWRQFQDVGLFITSDTMITKHSALFEKEQFLVGVLDEAHLIKNDKSKLAKCIKTLSFKHKLALTGTPIQNNLLELWSIFDFLMPNYLGTREEFKKNFSRLFGMSLSSIELSKMDLTDDQTKDLQLLHQRVLPFILRRLKGQVLQDLPEKLIQDYECEMTDLQKKIYKVFEDNDLVQIEKDLNVMEKPDPSKPTPGPSAPESSVPEKQIPVLKVLKCMRMICNHPKLVDPKYYAGFSAEEMKELEQYDSSAKLRGLRTLFQQLGFDPEEDNYENGNKVLIFTRCLTTMELLEGFFKVAFPKIKTCKINGKMDTTVRYNVIDKFVNEFDLKVMLLTTKVGGLGLNLSCANIVVMFDHDFNPMNDIQAMDRAHRLGQKKVVNVYRFILKDTLEEKIMGYALG